MNPFLRKSLGVAILLSVALAPQLSADALQPRKDDELARGFLSPQHAARPHVYWLWPNGYVHGPSASEELRAMKQAGFGGLLLFEMGMRGRSDRKLPAGPAFLSPEWVKQLRASTQEAKALGLTVDMSVISSWDLGGPWVEPHHASMGLYTAELTLAGGGKTDVVLPFPAAELKAPKAADGKPAFWRDVAVLAVRNPVRMPGHDFVIQLDPEGEHEVRELVLNNGVPDASAELAATMTPVRTFRVEVSTQGTRDADFRQVLEGKLPATSGAVRYSVPAGTKARYVRLTLVDGHDPSRPRWSLGEFAVIDAGGVNVAGARVVHPLRNGSRFLRAPVPLSYNEWKPENLVDGETSGPGGVFVTAGLPPFKLLDQADVVDVTRFTDKEGRLVWDAPPGRWSVLRYVCMITGERLKVPSPASDGLATDHLNPAATRLHMNHVVTQLQAGFGDLRTSGLNNLYLASYEVVGRVWSPGFADEFNKRRGYSLVPYLPAIFGALVGDEETTERFLFDYQKTLGEVVVDAYYLTAREVAHAAGLTIKSEAGGPGPPIHTPPMDALLANGAVDSVQGEFWPHWEGIDSIWVVKETAAAAHIYGKPIVHMEAFTSFHHWADGPSYLKTSADRAFCEGSNHFVWHTWTHQPPGMGLPGVAYHAGTHINRNLLWWPKAGLFVDYIARASSLLQRGRFVADVLYYYGDGGANFVGPRRNPPTLGPGYDYDVTNADVILNRLEVRDGRLTLPDGMSYALLVLPDREDIHPAVLARIEALVRAGATVVGRKPVRATGLEGFPASDDRVREIAGRLWSGLEGQATGRRSHGGGQVFAGVTEREVLAGLGIKPDFVGPASVDFTHRRDGAQEIYFLRNKTNEPVAANVAFRSAGLRPELWNPAAGTMEYAAVFRQTAAGVELPVNLPPDGSVFVIFREASPGDDIVAVSDGATIRNKNGTPVLQTERNGNYEIARSGGRIARVQVEDLPAPLALDEGWSLDFSSPVGNPPGVKLPRVGAWTTLPGAEYRYFSGTGTYKKMFSLPAGWRGPGQRVELDLGELWTMGEVWINGVSLGTLWTAPYRLDCTALLREGENELTVKVTNTWHNRLVGDACGDEAARVTSTNIGESQGKPWKELEPAESGLIGPVRLVPVADRVIPQ